MGIRLKELDESIEALLEELSFLEDYQLVAVKNFELSPDKTKGKLSGRRCHGAATPYPTVNLDVHEFASKGEVILAKTNRSDWLSLRPWFLYAYDLGYANQGLEELLVLNDIGEERLKFIGLISGESYRIDGEDWLRDSPFATVIQAGLKGREIISAPTSIRPEPSTEDSGVEGEETTESSFDTNKQVVGALRSLTNVALKPRRSGNDGETWVVIQSPIRDVPVALIDKEQILWLHLGSLQRAVRDGLITKRDLDGVIEDLGENTTTKGSIISVGRIDERLDWLKGLLGKFKGT